MLTGQVNGQRNKGIQGITYLMTLSKWMLEQALGEITKRKKVIKDYKGQEDVEGHDRLRFERTRNLRE